MSDHFIGSRYGCFFKLLLFLVFLMNGKHIYAQINEAFFNVVYSKSESWAGGPVGSGSGVNYTFSIKFKKKVDIRFDTLWIGDKPALITNNNSQKNKSTCYFKEDSVIIYAASYYPVKMLDYYLKQTENIPDEKVFKNPLPGYKCIALIQFYANDKVYYYGLNKFDVETYTAYP